MRLERDMVRSVEARGRGQVHHGAAKSPHSSFVIAIVHIMGLKSSGKVVERQEAMRVRCGPECKGLAV